MRRALSFTSLFLAATLSPGPGVSFGQVPKGGQAQPVQEQNRLDSSPALFAVLAAMNAAGYDADVDSPSNSPLRAAVRKWVQARNPPSLEALKRFYETHRQTEATADLAQYISFALLSEGPPAFRTHLAGGQLPPDVGALDGLAELMTAFSREASLEQAWTQAQPPYEAAIARYHEPVTQAVMEANAYLRNPTSGTRGHRFVVVVDLLGAPNQVHSRVYGSDYYVVVTPSAELKTREIRHAYLDYLIDPLSMRNTGEFEKKKGLGDLAQASPLLSEEYKSDFVRLASMSLVRAVEARLDRSLGAAYIERSMREGYILTAYFAEALPAYEKQELAFRLYLPQMIQGIDLAREDKRIAKVAFASQRSERTVIVTARKPPELTVADKDEDQADKLYQKRDLAGAKAAYGKVLDEQAPQAVHAKACFGLARIAALEKQPELSQQLFERTLELEPEAFERAWAHVYLARLSRAAQDPAGALKHYQAALEVEGASEGARKAAQEEMPAAASASQAASKQEKP